ncbi:AfsR/SARP family transcriptional regulator [Amycolatopsis aidingensis]|uniref:AfsR/SARP family transcriptional regulator n=1 Tax=Amycolatopsis aidingensis TaxID=2842453 RepID=UPI001C0D98BC|nr:AfsR/SARP family transcriptional regulator [Amycolatopsis aidingensis]
MNDVRFRVLGPVAVYGASGPLRLGGPKQRSVLAMLLLNANQVVEEERLVRSVWGEDPPPSARGQVQVHVSGLRKLIGKSAIVRKPPGYLLRVAPGELDLELFEDAVTGAAADRSARALRSLRGALELWQGPALGGVTEPLLDSEGPALEERRLAALERRFELELELGEHATVLAELRRAAGQHPFRERLQAQLMLALHHNGDSSEALEVHARTRRQLAAELGIEPGPLLQQAQQLVLRGQERDAEPVPAIRPAELPHDIHDFTGRERELALMDARQRAAPDGAPSISVISGTVGVGKSAFAVHWARAAGTAFPDGQLYVNLRGFDPDYEPVQPAAALARLLRALGVAPERIPQRQDELAGLYRSVLAERKVLLLLDNAREAEQVYPLLPPAGTVLVTSRNRLGGLTAHAGARPLPLDTLPATDARALLENVLGADRVAAEPEAAAELARSCGYLPLTLRVAAANIASAPRADIAGFAAALSGRSRLTELAVDGTGENAVARAFAVSYRALGAETGRLFRLLALVPGTDFTPGVAAALAGVTAPEASRLLRGLTAAHLVEEHRTGRYRFHDLLRHYARERVGADESPAERDRAWRRLAGAYLAAADRAVRLLGREELRLPRTLPSPEGGVAELGDEASASAWLDDEEQNLTAAVRQAVAKGPFPLAWYLSDSLRLLLQHRGRWLGPRGTLAEASHALDRARRNGDLEAEADALMALGAIENSRGRHEAARRHLHAVWAIAGRCWPDGADSRWPCPSATPA